MKLKHCFTPWRFQRSFQFRWGAHRGHKCRKRRASGATTARAAVRFCGRTDGDLGILYGSTSLLSRATHPCPTPGETRLANSVSLIGIAQRGPQIQDMDWGSGKSRRCQARSACRLFCQNSGETNGRAAYWATTASSGVQRMEQKRHFIEPSRFMTTRRKPTTAS